MQSLAHVWLPDLLQEHVISGSQKRGNLWKSLASEGKITDSNSRMIRHHKQVDFISLENCLQLCSIRKLCQTQKMWRNSCVCFSTGMTLINSPGVLSHILWTTETTWGRRTEWSRWEIDVRERNKRVWIGRKPLFILKWRNFRLYWRKNNII